MLENLYKYRTDLGLAAQKCENLGAEVPPEGVTESELQQKADDVNQNLNQSIEAVQVRILLFPNVVQV